MSLPSSLDALTQFGHDLAAQTALAVALSGLFAGYLIGRVNTRLLRLLGVPDAVEGTEFERTLNRFNTSTAALLGRLSSWLIYSVVIIVGLHIHYGSFHIQYIWNLALGFLPRLFIAICILIASLILGDKLRLAVTDALSDIKIPQPLFVPRLLKYSLVYVGVLLALQQFGIDTTVLLALFVIYVAAVLWVVGLALKDIFAAGAAGLYLVLTQPYTIGDHITLAECDGTVQEIDLITTRIEHGDGTEYVIPNHHLLRTGVARREQ